MPKRTKKEKIIAEYRRRLLVVSDKDKSSKSVDERHSGVPQSSFIPTFTIPRTVPTNQRNDTLIDPQEFIAIKKDLIKTLIVTCCIIIGQIAIWRVVG